MLHTETRQAIDPRSARGMDSTELRAHFFDHSDVDMAAMENFR